MLICKRGTEWHYDFRALGKIERAIFGTMPSLLTRKFGTMLGRLEFHLRAQPQEHSIFPRG